MKTQDPKKREERLDRFVWSLIHSRFNGFLRVRFEVREVLASNVSDQSDFLVIFHGINLFKVDS